MSNIKKSPLFVTYIILLVVMIVLPFFSVPSYVIWKNTTSHLGAQNAPNAWIMNVTFILLGIATFYESWRKLGKFYFQKIVISIFAIGLMMTGVFQHAPIIEGVEFNVFQDKMHSIFASLVGFSFTLFAISSTFIESKMKKRYIAISIGILATFLSVLIFNISNLSGVWQRILFAGSFAWLLYFFKDTPKSE